MITQKERTEDKIKELVEAEKELLELEKVQQMIINNKLNIFPSLNDTIKSLIYIIDDLKKELKHLKNNQ